MQSHIDGTLTGDAHTRFTCVTTLLWLIDPVRGEASVHGLDKHPHDTSWRKDHLQKKFLESFALVCSTSAKGGETASALCFEDGRPPGTVLRVARNLGVPPQLVASLQDILNDLIAVANRGTFLPNSYINFAFRLSFPRIHSQRNRKKNRVQNRRCDAGKVSQSSSNFE